MITFPPRISLLPVFVAALSFAAPPDDYQPTREALVEQINAARKAAGVGPLRLSAELSTSAQQRVSEIVAGRKPTPEPGTIVSLGKPVWRLISEIEARTEGDVESVVASWREKEEGPGSNLVGAEFHEIGIGVSFETEVPLYVLFFALSWDDFFLEQTAALSNLENVRARMLARVNKERLAHKLAPLRRHPRLDEAAQHHADDMFTKRYYSHDSADGKTAIDRIQALGYRAKYAGENIARGQYSVDEVMDGWMESKTHRDHLLSPVFDDVGFGLAFGKNPGGYEIIWVQNFARPKGRERL